MKVGFGQSDMTPYGGKTAVTGSLRSRYTDVVQERLYAVAMVLEGNGYRTIWVSCDMCHPVRHLTDEVVARLSCSVSGFQAEELILNGTHATACCLVTDKEINGAGKHVEAAENLPLDKLREQICDAVEKAVLEALNRMTECCVEFSTIDILTGYCRRVMYRDGSAVMYGNVKREDFLRMEYPDGGPVKVLYFYEEVEHKLVGILAAVPCPSQCDEVNVHITSDYWAAVRKKICTELGVDIKVLAVCRAAGELSPHRLMKGDGSSRDSEYGIEKAQKLGNFIAENIIREKDRPQISYSGDKVVHKRITRTLKFPVRQATKKELDDAEKYFANPENFDKYGAPFKIGEYMAYESIRKRHKDTRRDYGADVSVLRIGDILFYTAPAELYCEYARRIDARFFDYPMIDVQLANDCLGYLPTKEATERGGYSTQLLSTVTTPDGGELYVEEVTKMLKEIFN